MRVLYVCRHIVHTTSNTHIHTLAVEVSEIKENQKLSDLASHLLSDPGAQST